MNGIIRKYWPLVKNFSNIYSKEQISRQKKVFENEKRLINITNDKIQNMIKYNEKYKDEMVKCDNFTITLMKLVKKCKEKNFVYLSELFTDIELSKKVPFIKLMFDSYEDNIYKVHKYSLDSNDGNVSKEKLKSWTDDYKIQEYYGYNYIYSGNLIEIKLEHNE